MADAAFETVDALIERVMKVYRVETTYYREVHQELAPLARDLERALADRDRRIEALTKALDALTHMRRDRSGAYHDDYGAMYEARAALASAAGAEVPNA